MKRSGPDHPKVKHLASLLHINEAWAVGILELLWHFTAKYAPQGDVGKHTDEVIAHAVKWDRPSGRSAVTPQWRLSEALVEAQWLDRCTCHRLVVHDWPEHADQAVTRFLSRHGLDFVHIKTSLPAPVASSQSQKPEPAAASAAADAPLPPAARPLAQIIPAALAACAAAAPTLRAQAEKALLLRQNDIRAARNPEGLAHLILRDFGITPAPQKKRSAHSGDDYNELVQEIARQKNLPR